MRAVLTLPGRDIVLPKGQRILGRAPHCDVVLEEKSISREHALVDVSSHSVVVRDLGSMNGTWVNGMRLGGDRRLRHGDRLVIGSIAMNVRISSSVEGDAYDDGWLAMQSVQLASASAHGHTHDADEIVFRVAEAFESRAATSEPFGLEVTDAALAAVIDYAIARERPGWIRWASTMHTKLSMTHGPAVRRSLENAASRRRTA